MDGVNGKPFTTKQYALVAVGKSQREWPFLSCSNSKFTEVRNALDVDEPHTDRYRRNSIVIKLQWLMKI